MGGTNGIPWDPVGSPNRGDPGRAGAERRHCDNRVGALGWAGALGRSLAATREKRITCRSIESAGPESSYSACGKGRDWINPRVEI
jgi:hypothetical protein